MTRESKYRILIVDDSDEMREVFSMLLRSAKVEILGAATGEDALTQFKTAPPDLVLLDYDLPGISGLDVLKVIRERGDQPEVPVIMVSGSGLPEVRYGSIEAGANDFQPKDCDLADLTVRVQRFLDIHDAQLDLERERRQQGERLNLLIQGAALLAGGAHPDVIYAGLDKEVQGQLGIRIASVLELTSAGKQLRLVYPEKEILIRDDIDPGLASALEKWENCEEPVEGEPGVVASPRHPPGRLWFPYRASGRLLGAIGYHQADGSRAPLGSDASVGPVMAALSRLIGLAAENRELSAAERERAGYEIEMRSAIVAQEGVLPREIPADDRFDTAAVSIPARSTGGDYFGYFLYADGSRGSFMSDIVGKGLEAAMRTMVLNTLVREHGPLARGPEELLRRINSVLHDRLDGSDEDPIPCTAIRFGSAGHPDEIELANAGHELPLVVRADGSAAYVPFHSSFPLGWHEPPRVAASSIRLAPGDTLVLYSDGLLDIQQSSDAVIGAGKLADWLGLEKSPLAALAVRRAVERVKRMDSQPDDVTLILVKGTNPIASGDLVTHLTAEGVDYFCRSTLENVGRVRKASAEFMTSLGVSGDDVFNITSVLTEIHTNAIVHGQAGRLDQPLRIGIREAIGGLELEVEEFHCGGYQPPVGPSRSGLRDGGGMGLVLARKVMERLEWVPTERISLRVRMIWKRGG